MSARTWGLIALYTACVASAIGYEVGKRSGTSAGYAIAVEVCHTYPQECGISSEASYCSAPCWNR